MPVTYEALLTERDGLIAQHHRDSAELRSLCSARDEARKQRDALREALQAAVDCGMVPKSSASDGGACKHSEQVLVADQIRAALSK